MKKRIRADSFGGAAGEGAAPEHSEAEGRANQMKFDIFCKPPALLRSTHQGLRPYCNKSEEGSEELNDEEYLFQSLHPSLCSGFRPSSLYVIEKGKLKTLRNLDEGEMTKCHNVFMSYIVYILECSDNSYYVGCTNNLEKRLKQHNESRWGAHYTKIRRPVILKYSEEFKTLIEARRREAEIKGWRRGKKEKLWIAT